MYNKVEFELEIIVSNLYLHSLLNTLKTQVVNVIKVMLFVNPYLVMSTLIQVMINMRSLESSCMENLKKRLKGRV